MEKKSAPTIWLIISFVSLTYSSELKDYLQVPENYWQKFLEKFEYDHFVYTQAWPPSLCLQQQNEVYFDVLNVHNLKF